MPQPFRLPPNLPVGDYQTYAIRSPADVLVKTACEAVRCENWQFGWESHIDERTELGQQQAAFIRTQSGRTFTELHTVAGLTVFRFGSGQRCFEDHRTRPERFLVRDGDWRGNPTGRSRQHTRAADWVEDFGGHQQQLADQIERG